MTKGAVDKVRDMGAELIVTVDCGSLCHAVIAYASELGIRQSAIELVGKNKSHMNAMMQLQRQEKEHEINHQQSK